MAQETSTWNAANGAILEPLAVVPIVCCHSGTFVLASGYINIKYNSLSQIFSFTIIDGIFIGTRNARVKCKVYYVMFGK